MGRWGEGLPAGDLEEYSREGNSQRVRQCANVSRPFLLGVLRLPCDLIIQEAEGRRFQRHPQLHGGLGTRPGLHGESLIHKNEDE